MPRRAAGRRRPPETKVVLLPALKSPPRCSGSNQHEVDAAEREWDDRHRRSRRRRLKHLPSHQLAYVYLPPVFPINGYHYDEFRHYRHHRETKSYSRWRSHSSDEEFSGSSESISDEDSDYIPVKPTTMRSQRLCSLAAMSKLQHDAASTIQREYRFYRRRRANRNRRKQRLSRQAQGFLNVFLLQEVVSLVPVCLLEVLRERCIQEAAATKRREDLSTSLADSVLMPLVDECIRDVFHDTLHGLVKSYLAQHIDLSRAATPTAYAVATDIVDDWTTELVADLIPEVIVELASEYTTRQRHEVIWEELLHDQLESTASDAI